MARVGAAHHPSSPSSLRVDPGTMPEIQIGSRVCRRDEAPCYILEEEDLPEVVSRCLSLSDELTSAYVAVCDETVVPFHGEWGLGYALLVLPVGLVVSRAGLLTAFVRVVSGCPWCCVGIVCEVYFMVRGKKFPRLFVWYSLCDYLCVSANHVKCSVSGSRISDPFKNLGNT